MFQNTEPVQVRAEIDRIAFRNEDNGYTILKARNCDNNTTITATGHFPDVRPGELFQFTGTWSQHPTYGRQFKIERSASIRPTSPSAIGRYLSSGLIRGIGEKTAAKIVAHFGADTFNILDNDPGCLLQVKGISRRKSLDIIESWKDQKAASDVMMFLVSHEISLRFAKRIYALYGGETIEKVSANPYQLAHDIGGIGFISADKIAASVGISRNSPERIRAAVDWQLQQGEDKGHCFLTTEQLQAGLSANLGLQLHEFEASLQDSLKLLNETGVVVSLPVVDDESNQKTDIHYRGELFVAETEVATGIGRLLVNPIEVDLERVDRWLESYATRAETALTVAQIAAVRQAAENRVFILTGGPGVGKTTTANTIIRLFKAMGKKVALAAPTGRAAQRLSEVAAEKAQTIHRLLEWNPGQAFTRHEDNPLEVDVVIIDESSMVDIRLAQALVRAVSKRSQLVFIGDVDQLPSVGPGNILRDLIDSGKVPFVKLNEVFRQAANSRIVRAAHAINQGESPEFSNEFGSDCQFLEVETLDDIKRTIEHLVVQKIGKESPYHPIRDTQILTPMNRGDLGTEQLNSELQQILNPASPGKAEYKAGAKQFRLGDKVIQIVNNYELGVFNGDIGFVSQVNVDGGKMLVDYPDGRQIAYNSDTAQELRLAYAITIHKSQGSEFPVVILPISMQHYIMLQRNLFYTGLTRAKRLAFFVGSKRALGQAIRTQTSSKRQTMLIERLTKICAQA